MAQQEPAPSVPGSAWVAYGAPSHLTAPLRLWATFYHVYQATAIAPNRGYPLLGIAGDRLGPSLSQHDWCQAALQGTVQVLDLGSGLGSGQHRAFTYNFAGRGDAEQVDCAPFFSSLSAATLRKVNRVRFAASAAPYGNGTDGLNLVPYRTIAVDRRQIPVGSVVFIPAARGVVVTLPSGQQVVHDGYFFAGDVGSAIKGPHIDVFVGTTAHSPFAFITSKSNGVFEAYLVADRAIAQSLRQLHRP